MYTLPNTSICSLVKKNVHTAKKPFTVFVIYFACSVTSRDEKKIKKSDKKGGLKSYNSGMNNGDKSYINFFLPEAGPGGHSFYV